ncbi:MAG: DUF2807 domain-containing protein [Blastocatellia bacterium]|nr:DUF2807 domain-containing protein [Blastocatellia bacterium]
MKVKLSAILVLSISLFSGCIHLTNKDSVKGSGKITSQKRTLAPFDSVETEGIYSLTFVCQDDEDVEITGDDNILPLIITEVKNRTLRIKQEKDISPTQTLKVKIANPELQKIRLEGAGKADITNLQNENFNIEVEGASSIKASGQTKTLNINVEGAATVDVKDLRSEKAFVKSEGAGNIDLFASELLDINMEGVGKINYYGNPKTVNKKISGVGTVNKQ